MGFITVGLTFEQSLGFPWDILDDKIAFTAIFLLSDLVKPVRITLDNLNTLKVPIDSSFLNVNLTVNLDGSVLDVTEALELSGEVAGLS